MYCSGYWNTMLLDRLEILGAENSLAYAPLYTICPAIIQRRLTLVRIHVTFSIRTVELVRIEKSAFTGTIARHERRSQSWIKANPKQLSSRTIFLRCQMACLSLCPISLYA